MKRLRRSTRDKGPRMVLDSESASASSDPDAQIDDMDTDPDTSEEECMSRRGWSPISTSEGMDSEEEKPLDLAWRSKNGKIFWQPTNSVSANYNRPDMLLKPGPTHYAVSRVYELSDSFDLFITEEIFAIITNCTNLYGRRKDPQWQDLDGTTIRAYIGLLLLAGVYRSRGEAIRSLWDAEMGRHIFRATMPSKQFQLISSMLRFDDPRSRSQRGDGDKLAAIRELWDEWTEQLPRVFNPGKHVCVDEQLLAFRGRCHFRQYMPKKPSKYGMKIWATCDVQTSYAWKLLVYTGRVANSPVEKQQGQRVVLEMTEGLTGVTVTCDNFFTSYDLGTELLQRQNTLVGTIRKNRAELPPELLKVQTRAPLSSLFAFTENHTLVSYVPKRGKNVLLLSTKHRGPEISNHVKKKPQIILDYNRCKGGVDTMDAMIATYSCRRKSKRWPLTLFFNILDVSAVNAFIVWTAIDPTWNHGKSNKRRLFLQELGKKLVMPHMSRRQHLPQSPGATRLVLQARTSLADRDGGSFAHATDTPATPASRRQCVFCSTRKVCCCTCIKCGKNVCKEHYRTICSSCFH
ncbi:piggyBac transposable element-derived protein 4-like [Denticeps clupeoides]|uniref:PiggyBac transposable element-derived protein domain-containing protein n=1 Tax=Denticeps clupeoides TaxID=299321 RepID=A0AAY4BI19_9TELE|nr:piggyBac transposable element-derived protein 4-like [Denticeps clupeoides]